MIDREVQQFLLGMEYPATREDLLREAAIVGSGNATSQLLRTLPAHGYHGSAQVRTALEQPPRCPTHTPRLAG